MALARPTPSFRQRGPSTPPAHPSRVVGQFGQLANPGQTLRLAQDVWMLDARNHGKSPPRRFTATRPWPKTSWIHGRTGHRESRSLLGHSMGGKTVLLRSPTAPRTRGQARGRRHRNQGIHARTTDPFLTPCWPQTPRRQLHATPSNPSSHGHSGTTLCSCLFDERAASPERRRICLAVQRPCACDATLHDVVGHVDWASTPCRHSSSAAAKATTSATTTWTCSRITSCTWTTTPFDGAGHWLHAQAPDEFYEVTADFLA